MLYNNLVLKNIKSSFVVFGVIMGLLGVLLALLLFIQTKSWFCFFLILIFYFLLFSIFWYVSLRRQLNIYSNKDLTWDSLVCESIGDVKKKEIFNELVFKIYSENKQIVFCKDFKFIESLVDAFYEIEKHRLAVSLIAANEETWKVFFKSFHFIPETFSGNLFGSKILILKTMPENEFFLISDFMNKHLEYIAQKVYWEEEFNSMMKTGVCEILESSISITDEITRHICLLRFEKA